MNISTFFGFAQHKPLNARKLLLSILTITTISATAQIVTIPDAGLKQNLFNHGITITGPGIGVIDTNGDSEIQVSEALAYTGKIQLGITPAVGFSDATGLEAFVNTTQLHLQFAAVSSLDLSQNNALTEIYVASDVASFSLTLPQTTSTLVKLTIFGAGIPPTIDVTPYTNLTDLFFRVPTPISLDLSALINLVTLRCDQSNLTSLTLPATATLTSVDCIMNNLTTLDVSQLSGLELLNINANQLISLDVSANTNLTSLYCPLNQLTSLNAANGNNSNFTDFSANNNSNLTCIQVDNVAYSTTNWTNIDATASFSTNCSLGINENGLSSGVGLSSEVEIYPNPATNQITIDFGVSTSLDEQNQVIKSITIIDITGKTVKTIVSNNNTIDISNLTKGVYFLQVQTENGSVNSKFIKK